MRVHIGVGRNATVWLRTFVLHITYILMYLASNIRRILLRLIYVYNSVIQALWFLNLLIRQVAKRIMVVPTELN